SLMKKGGGCLILSAIGLDFVIQQTLITFFYPEIINISKLLCVAVLPKVNFNLINLLKPSKNYQAAI
ncbi:TPA: hypothetical protein ACJJCB_002041, partial [Neisseria meningitidis]